MGIPEPHRGGGVNDGGLHVHLAVNGFYDVTILRECWWSVVGEGQGNVQVEGPNRRRRFTGKLRPKDTGYVARYLCKYISKSFFDSPRAPGRHRYWISRRLSVPVEKMRLHGSKFSDHEYWVLEWLKSEWPGPIYKWRSEDELQFMFSTFPP